MVKRYGEPVSMEDFCNKMQLMNAIGYQGIFEAAGHKLNDIGGVMLWKLNAAFPSVVWQVYDWFLQTNAGYYFMQNACEPLHIQLNLSNLKVTVINRNYKSSPNLTAQVEVFNSESRSLFKDQASLSLGSTEVKETTDITSHLESSNGLSFIVLNLKNSAGVVVSHNVYWLSLSGDYKVINNLSGSSVNVTMLKSEKFKSESRWTVRITNNSGKIAFFIRPRLLMKGEEVLPSYWTGSYLTLAPGESVVESVTCPNQKLKDKNFTLQVKGLNTNEVSIKVN
jgi:hypothetical protein